MMRCILVLLGFLSARSMFGEPVVFWVSDPVKPDDTVIMTGAGFGDAPTIELVELRNGRVGEDVVDVTWPRRGRVRAVDPIDPADESVKFTVPEDVREGMWLVRLTGPAGSVLARINAPTVYWVQGRSGLGSSAPGAWLRVFGRCLSWPGERATVRLEPVGGGDPILLRDDTATLWSVRVELPSDLPEGRWRVAVHNGLGDEVGWTDAGEVDIQRPQAWPRTVYNVRDYGASGQGRPDDGLAIAAALGAAERAGGGIVYLPRGRYRMDHTLRLPRYTVLAGESRELVSIFWPDTETPYTLVQGRDHFGIQDVTLYASNYIHGIAADIGEPTSGHTFLRRIRIRAVLYRGHLKPDEVDARFRAHLRHSTGGGDTVRLGGERVEISDCDLYGSGRALFLLRVRGAVVANNTFWNGRWGWYCLDGSDGLIFENNRILGADLMSTGGGINCLSSPCSQNIYYAGNTVARCHGWDREAMTSDAGFGVYFGPVEALDALHLRLPEAANWRKGAAGTGVFIMHGRGMGQYRQVAEVSDDGCTVTLDRPLQVQPDGTSVVSITWMHRQYLFINNRFEDAGIGLQYYGTSIDHVAAGNSCERAGGFYNSGRWYRHFQPSWYCQFLGNAIIEGNGYRFGANNATGAGDSFIGTYGLAREGFDGPLAFAAVHRRNHLHNNAQIRIRGIRVERPGVRDVVVEHNLIEHVDTGLYVDDGCRGVHVRSNTFRNVVRERFDPEEEARRRREQTEALLALEGPVFHIDFEDASPTMVPDASGQGFNALIRGRLQVADGGLAGACARFDGASSLLIPGSEVLEFEHMTLSAWVLPDQLKGRWGVLAKRTANTTAPWVLALRDGTVTFEAADRDGDWSYNLIGTRSLVPGRWNHIAAVCDSGARVRVYCNGEPTGDKTVDTPLMVSDNLVTIGYEAWGGPNSDPKEDGSFMGLIDEVRMWTRSLTDAEIADLYAVHADAVAADAGRRKAAAEARERRLAEAAKVLDSSGGTAFGVTWTPIAVLDGEEDTMPAEWISLRGEWSVRDGTLRCRGTSFLALDRPLKPPVRIEFDARSAHPGDLTAFFGTQDLAYKGGYFIGFASNGNTVNKILRLGEDVARNAAPNATPGTWHHVVAQVIGGTVELIVDGQPVLSFDDDDPPGAADTIGIIAWEDAEFDNVVVFAGRDD